MELIGEVLLVVDGRISQFKEGLQFLKQMYVCW
jgi:hypothetical protein